MNILFADNDKDFLDTRAEYLEAAGYKVFKAYSYEEAVTFLDTAYCYPIHLAILDIRLVDEDDIKDKSGLDLVDHPDYQFIPKIVLTNWPEYEEVREYMKPDREGKSKIVDYIYKQRGAEEMITAVQDAFSTHVHSNPDLSFGWSDKTKSFAPLVLSIYPDRFNQMQELTIEMRELFRRLFYTYTQTTISRVLWEKEERIALEVFCHNGDRIDTFAVTCGTVAILREELKRFDAFAPHVSMVSPVTRVWRSEETRHFCAVAWELVDGVLEQMISLGDYYREKNVHTVRQAVTNLFKQTLMGWFAQPKTGTPELETSWKQDKEEPGSQEIYRQKIFMLGTEAKKWNIVKELKLEKDQISFDLPGHWHAQHPDPYLLLTSTIDLSAQDVTFVNSPGSLDPSTVLVDLDGRTWLTDFSRAGLFPAWYGFVELETTLLFDFLSINDLPALDEFDGALLPAEPMDKSVQIDFAEAEFKKLGVILREVRSLAAHSCGRNPQGYYMGLLQATMQGLFLYHDENSLTRRKLIPLLHRLLFAGRLVESLLQVIDMDFSNNSSSSELRPISLDPGKEVFSVGDHPVALTDTEFQLLQLLFFNQGKVVKSQQIVTRFFPNASDLDDQTSWITTTIFRLRRKLGSNRYVKNIRNKGYQLVIDPASEI